MGTGNPVRRGGQFSVDEVGPQGLVLAVGSVLRLE